MLNIAVDRTTGGLICMNQEAYIMDIAKKFKVDKANPKRTPMVTGAVLDKTQMPELGSAEHQAMLNTPYRSLMGALQYASNNRPDIKAAVSKLGHFMSNPATVHWKALKHVLKYLVTTKDLKMVIGSDKKEQATLKIFVDADHGGDRGTGRSTSGIVFKYGDTTLDCISKRQTAVANSTGAAEMMALADAVRNSSVMRIMLEEINVKVSAIPIYTDAQVVVDMLKKGHPSSKLKHLALAFYTIKDKMVEGKITVHHIPGVDNCADILTKPLPRATFEKHRCTLLNNHIQLKALYVNAYSNGQKRREEGKSL